MNMVKSIIFMIIVLSASLVQAQDTHKVLDFSATWCGPCQQMKANVWNSILITKYKQNHPNVIIEDVDFDKNPKLVKEYKVRAVPTIIILKNNKETARKVGYQSSTQLLSFFRKEIDGVRQGGIKMLLQKVGDR